MDFTAEAMQKTLDIARPEIHTIKDIHGATTEYSTKQLHQVIAKAPEQPEAVSVLTLAGFADLIKANLEGLDFTDGFIIHIENERTVVLKSGTSDEYGRRLALVKCQPVPFEQFRFGQWMSQEEFAISVASKFSDTPDRAYVLNMASTLTNDATSTSEDDGFAQRVNIKAGLRMKSEITLKPRVDLAPYRTFPEIEQPMSGFILRARANGSENGQPSLMLIEADGGAWKLQAISTIKAAVESFDLKVSVIA